MLTLSDAEAVLSFLKMAGLRKAPGRVDEIVRAYHAVLINQPPELLNAAAITWMQDPDGGKWFPSAPDMLDCCLRLEAQRREGEKTESTKDGGCESCGRRRYPDNPMADRPGSGWRHVIQRCYPRDEHGDIDWTARPYRIGIRRVLCDCDMGEHISLTQRMAEGARPVPTIADVDRIFHRTDSRLYLTGSLHRAVEADTRPGSPFYACPSPEEELHDLEHAQAQRQLAYGAIRGNIPAHLQGYLMEAFNNSRGPAAKKQTKQPTWMRVGEVLR